MNIEILGHRDTEVAGQIHALLVTAHAQEAGLLGVQNPAPMNETAADIQASDEFFLGCFENTKEGAAAGKNLIGVISVRSDDEPAQINIARLAVSPTHQRCGVASALLASALQRAAGAQFSVSTTAKNSPALALYRQFSFVPYRWGTLGEDGLDLVKLRRV